MERETKNKECRPTRKLMGERHLDVGHCFYGAPTICDGNVSSCRNKFYEYSKIQNYRHKDEILSGILPRKS